jgi:hemoglobin-like flavoprotein
MGNQGKKLLNSLVLVVENLRNPEALGPVLKALGAGHVGYGAIPKYYGLVGEALLITFEQYLKEDWTSEVKKAWLDAFTAITSLMLKGAGEKSSPQSLQSQKPPILEKPVGWKASGERIKQVSKKQTFVC